MSRPAPIRFAVFPVAGRGTRFLPATKASPKEMLPIVDKPLIQYAVEEALAAGARTLVFITGSSKRAIEDHFDTDPELEAALEAQGKKDLLDALRGILPADATCIYHPPAGAARPRPRGAVRAAGRRRRAVLRASRGRPDRCRRAGARADARSLPEVRRQRASACSRCRAARPAATASLPSRIGSAEFSRIRTHRREAEAGRGAVGPCGRRPLPAVAGRSSSGCRRSGAAPAARSS